MSTTTHLPRTPTADNAAAQNAVIITTTVTLLSYVSGGLALGSAGTYYADQLTLLAAVLSLLVGAIAGERTGPQQAA